jgi:hypothetical protein
VWCAGAGGCGGLELLQRVDLPQGLEIPRSLPTGPQLLLMKRCPLGNETPSAGRQLAGDGRQAIDLQDRLVRAIFGMEVGRVVIIKSTS